MSSDIELNTLFAYQALIKGGHACKTSAHAVPDVTPEASKSKAHIYSLLLGCDLTNQEERQARIPARRVYVPTNTTAVWALSPDTDLTLNQTHKCF